MLQKYGKEKKLAMADSIIYAIAKKYNAILWTQDQHLKS
jgi:predicted nucleic acid-binding protein